MSNQIKNAEQTTYHILIERVVAISQMAEIYVEAGSLEEAMDIAESQHDNDLLDFQEVERDVSNVCFSKVGE